MAHRRTSTDEVLLAPPKCDFLHSKTMASPLTMSYLVPKGSLDEAEQHLIGLPGLFGFGLIDDTNHLIDALREQRVPLHLVNVVSILITFPSSNGHTVCW